MELLDEVTAAFEDFLASGQMAVVESEQTRTEQANNEIRGEDTEYFARKKCVPPSLKTEVTSFIMDLKMALLKLELIGACGTYPSSTETLHIGIENHLMGENSRSQRD